MRHYNNTVEDNSGGSTQSSSRGRKNSSRYHRRASSPNLSASLRSSRNSSLLRRLTIFTSRSNSSSSNSSESSSPIDLTAIQARNAIRMENEAAALEQEAMDRACDRTKHKVRNPVVIIEQDDIVLENVLDGCYTISHGNDVWLEKVPEPPRQRHHKIRGL